MPVWQAIAARILATVSEEPFRNVLLLGLEAKDALVEFATLLVQNAVDIAGASSSWKDAFESEAFEPVRNASSSLAKLGRCILHYFCADPPPGSLPCTDRDIQYFNSYSGENLFEKSIRRIFREEGSWWAAEFEEVVKMSATAVLVSQRLEELRSLLSSEDRSWSTLRAGLSLVKEVRGSTRSQKMGSLLDQFLATWPAILLQGLG